MTKLENIVNPQVIADMVNQKLQEKMKFSELCKIENVLTGRAGDKVTLPKYAYIGDAIDVAEGVAIPISTLTTTTEQVLVKKAGKGVELSDEAMLSGYGDPIGESAIQLSLSIANKVDNDVLQCLKNIKTNMTVGDGSKTLSTDFIADALIKFGENIGEEKALIIAPEQFSTLRKNEGFLKTTDIGVGMLLSGAVGMIYGCQIILSDKITKTSKNTYENYIVQPDAIAIYLKRETEIEKDRNITTKTTVITADKHYATHLAFESKAIKLIVKA